MSDCKGFDGLSQSEQNQVLDNLSHNFDFAKYAFAWLKIAVMITGLAIVFIWKQKNSKPTFIKIIWVLLCLA